MAQRRRLGTLAATLVLAALLALLGPGHGAAVLPAEPPELARLATSEDPQLAAAASLRLREMGQPGLDALLAAHEANVTALVHGTVDRDAPEIIRLRSAIDTVAAQRDAHASGLYWYTDLDAAKAEARRTGKSILSLRLLGRLDEELSCANSRLFRAVLYPDERVAALLRRRFVLHWSSERPAPTVTIDMGDGRRLVRTITGNSVHYVLDPRGRPVDAIPGLYGAGAFERALTSADRIAKRCRRADAAAFRACLADAHTAALGDQEGSWNALRGSILTGIALPARLDALSLGEPTPARGTVASAIDVDRLTITKSGIERPTLRAMELAPDADARRVAWWTQAARPTMADARVGERALGLIRLKRPGADPAAVVPTLRQSLAEDTVRNEYVLHRRIHERFASSTHPPPPVVRPEGDPRTPLGASLRSAPGPLRSRELAALNRWVYDELFLTPQADPWLGLRDPTVYDAIEAP